MTLLEILRIANDNYTENSGGMLTLNGFYDENTGKPIKKGGDGLAYFIVCELYETYDAEEDTDAQLRRADKVLSRASDRLLELSDVYVDTRLQLNKNRFDVS